MAFIQNHLMLYLAKISTVIVRLISYPKISGGMIITAFWIIRRWVS